MNSRDLLKSLGVALSLLTSNFSENFNEEKQVVAIIEEKLLNTDYDREFTHLKNRPNSTDYLEKLAQLFLSEKKDTKKISKLEQKVLTALEQEIMLYVDALPKKLKKLLPNWKQSFKKFKNKINLVKSDFNKFVQEKGTIVGAPSQDIMGSEYILAVVGLKPCTIREKEDDFPEIDLKSFAKKINNVYPEELIIYPFEHIYFEEKPRIEVAFISTHPLLPIEFVIKSYVYDELQTEVEKEFEIVSKNLAENYKKLIASNWITSFSSDQTALLLGLLPRVYDKQYLASEEDRLENNQRAKDLDLYYSNLLLLSDRAYAYRVVFLPGRVSLFERTTYARLYEMLVSYAWIALAGAKNYLEQLGAIVMGEEMSRSAPLEEFKENVEENYAEKLDQSDEESEEGDDMSKPWLEKALAVLKQAQKNQDSK